MKKVKKPLIEHGVPMPKAKAGAPEKYPFSQLAMLPAGEESFFVETLNKAKQSSVRNAATAAGKRHNCTFATRLEGDGIRVWREIPSKG